LDDPGGTVIPSILHQDGVHGGKALFFIAEVHAFVKQENIWRGSDPGERLLPS